MQNPPLNIATMTRDPRHDHCKLCPVPLTLLMQTLGDDGTMVPRVEGWPIGAEVLALTLTESNMGPTLVFTLYHKDFPIVLQDPPMLPMSWKWRPVTGEIDWSDPEASDAAEAT